MLLDIHHSASLGPTCNAAEFLRSTGLRRYSLPFDWIHSDVDIATDVLADGGAALLDRRSLQSSTVRSRTGRKPWRRRCLHRRYRTASQPHIFIHHDPATCDDDYARLHRSTDRLRRLLADREQRTLFLHLETNAAPDPEHRDACVTRGARLFECLRCHTSRFALVVVRAVPMSAGEAENSNAMCGPPREVELLHDRVDGGGGGADLYVLELACLTRTVVPFSRLATQVKVRVRIRVQRHPASPSTRDVEATQGTPNDRADLT